MRLPLFTAIEGLWFPENLPCSSAKSAPAQDSRAALSGGVDDVHLAAAQLGLERGNALIVMAAKLEMDPAHVRIDCRCSSARFFSCPAPVIADVGFHTRHPPMAAA